MKWWVEWECGSGSEEGPLAAAFVSGRIQEVVEVSPIVPIVVSIIS